jgi:hypothetical protein
MNTVSSPPADASRSYSSHFIADGEGSAIPIHDFAAEIISKHSVDDAEMTAVFDVGGADAGVSDSDDDFVNVGLRELEVAADREDIV